MVVGSELGCREGEWVLERVIKFVNYELEFQLLKTWHRM